MDPAEKYALGALAVAAGVGYFLVTRKKAAPSSSVPTTSPSTYTPPSSTTSSSSTYTPPSSSIPPASTSGGGQLAFVPSGPPSATLSGSEGMQYGSMAFSPGAFATIKGTNFTPGETLQITGAGSYGWGMNQDVTAGPDGSWTFNFSMPPTAQQPVGIGVLYAGKPIFGWQVKIVPGLSASPDPVALSQYLNIQGSGYPGNASQRITVNGQPYQWVMTGGDGSFSTSIPVNQMTASPGTLDIGVIPNNGPSPVDVYVTVTSG